MVKVAFPPRTLELAYGTRLALRVMHSRHKLTYKPLRVPLFLCMGKGREASLDLKPHGC